MKIQIISTGPLFELIHSFFVHRWSWLDDVDDDFALFQVYFHSVSCSCNFLWLIGELFEFSLTAPAPAAEDRYHQRNAGCKEAVLRWTLKCQIRTVMIFSWNVLNSTGDNVGPYILVALQLLLRNASNKQRTTETQDLTSPDHTAQLVAGVDIARRGLICECLLTTIILLHGSMNWCLAVCRITVFSVM